MGILQDKLNDIFDQKKLTKYKLSRLIGIADATLCQMITGKAKFSEKIIKTLLPIIEVPREDFDSWVVADKYPKELLELAIRTRKTFPYKRKSILTVKIDEILKNKGMSRTALAKQIKYSQSALNAMIVGKINMSKSVLERVSTALEIPQNEIQSWIIADKYSLKVLEFAHGYNKL
jgi:DNA-binding Xre family transcriptional regulator